MVQEFHVLRCFSCQTFQVQQVKKSKKWTCKVCGEKQSLIKEFGRGGAADCRKHVQKLNALRGQMLEVNSEELLSQREPDENYENKDVHESLDQSPESEQEVAQVSRWSKYTDQTAEGPNGHENEEEDETVYTERHRFRSQGTWKRKKISTSKSFENNCEDEESWTGCSGFKRRPYQHDRRFKSSWSKGSASTLSSCGRSGDKEPCASTNLPSSRQAVCYPTTCSSSTYTAENSGENKQQCNSSHKLPAVEVTKGLLLQRNSASVSSPQKFGKLKIENKDSKWDKFLTVVSNQQDEEEYDYEGHDSSNYSDTAVACFTEALTDMDVDSEECRYPLDGKTDSSALGRQKSVGDICVAGNLSSPNISHRSKPDSFENAVCKEPTLFKMPCSSLSINPLFFTDEDFDDTF